MTNPNAVVSDTQSAIAMAITGGVNNASLFSPSIANSPYNNINLFPRNKFPKSIEHMAKNVAWVDAMRASSPTRNHSEDSEAKKGWMIKHPSALGVFEEIMSAAKMKQVVIFLDYDGTLSPIVENPDQAYMAPEVNFFLHLFIYVYMK
ncbi:probable trehalose-phosphate phosphatase D [Tanacetum coccineum]